MPPTPEEVAAAVRVLAAFIAADRAETPAPIDDRVATAESNPLGSSRAFLDAARAGAFPSWIAKRRLTAQWSDVAAYGRTRKRKARARSQRADDAAALLRKSGARPAANDATSPRVVGAEPFRKVGAR